LTKVAVARKMMVAESIKAVVASFVTAVTTHATADVASVKAIGIVDYVGATVIEYSTVAAISTGVAVARKAMAAESTKVAAARRIVTVADILATAGAAYAKVTGTADFVGATVTENSTIASTTTGSIGSTEL
jgi:hypothetical protein